MSFIQHPQAQELVQLRTAYETALAAYDEKKAALVTATVARYLADPDPCHPMIFKDWLHAGMQDPLLEAEIWAATIAKLTPDAFAGWYMMRKNGQDAYAFQASDTRQAGQELRKRRQYAKDPTIIWSYVPMAEVLYPRR